MSRWYIWIGGIWGCVLVAFGIHGAQAQVSFPWPVTPFTESQQITGNFAEYRSTSVNGHFHNGTDIPKADGSPVYPVKNGRVVSLSTSGSNAFVRVDDIAYVHIAPNPALAVGDSVFASQTVLGTILSGLGHVHMTNGFVGSEKNSMLMGSGLTPYEDPWPPIIRYVKFFLNNSDTELQLGQLSGLVDIVVKVDEQNGPPGASTSRLNNGTYKIGYQILSADSSTVVFTPPNNGLVFQFDSKPSNSVVNTVYRRSLSSTTSHVYQVTNPNGQDGFWDTTTVPDSNYVVMVFAEDTRANADTMYVPIRTLPQDTAPPEQPRFRAVTEATSGGMHVQWYPNTDADLFGYRLHFSFDAENWALFTGEEALNAARSDTLIGQVLNRDVYFRLTAMDGAAVPNESAVSDTYGLSTGVNFLRKVLIVDGFDRISGGRSLPSHTFGFDYGHAVMAHQISFDTVPNEAVVDGSVSLGDYEAILWFLGDESVADETFSAEEQALLRTYLEDGGYLFANGSRIAYDLDPASGGGATAADRDFLHTYLRMGYAGDDPGGSSASGLPQTLLVGLHLQYGVVPYTPSAVDVIVPVGPTTAPILEYANRSLGGIQYEGLFADVGLPGKLVVMTMPFETITGAETRTAVMGQILDFFFDLAITANDPSAPGLGLPTRTALLPNYPNPFNPTTTIAYQLAESRAVTLQVVNMLGQKVRTLVEAHQPAGRYTIAWDGRNDAGAPVGSGMYILHLQAGDTFAATQKLVMVK